MTGKRICNIAPAALLLTVTAIPAGAYEFRCRWVERVGNVDTVIGGDGAVLEEVDLGFLRRIRLQLGVFDDAESVAPDGGFIGWNVGTIAFTLCCSPGDVVDTDPRASGVLRGS